MVDKDNLGLANLAWDNHRARLVLGGLIAPLENSYALVLAVVQALFW